MAHGYSDFILARSHENLRARWAVHPSVGGGHPVPPSRELFDEAVARANHVVSVMPDAVVESLLAGRWPERPK